MTSSELLRLPAAPRHDPSKDGNPYRWIVATAPVVREQQRHAIEEHRARVRAADED